jgi:hypothetical protein
MVKTKACCAYGTELKNIIIEGFIQRIKDRAERFDDNFPCKSYERDDRKYNCN